MVTTDEYWYMMKRVGFTSSELDDITMTMAIDYVNEYIKQNDPNRKPKARRATQADIDLL